MKATWNRIVQTLKGRRSTALPNADTEPGLQPGLDADLFGAVPTAPSAVVATSAQTTTS